MSGLSRAELEALAALHAGAFFGERQWSAEEFGALASGRGVGLARVSNAGLCGFALFRIAADEAELLSLAVAPARRGVGVGRALLALVEEAARWRGARRMLLEVGCANAAARALYRGAGYVDLGLRRNYVRGGDAAIMGRGLISATPRPERA